MRSPLDGLRAARALGWRKAWHYLRYQAQLRTGEVRRDTPIGTWAEVDSRSTASWVEGRFFFEGRDPSVPTDRAWADQARIHARTEADAVLNGRFRLFGLHQVELGFPPAWNRFPPLPGAESGAAVPADRHWSLYDLNSLADDIKLLWEPSRFGWAFTLARAYGWTQDERYAAGFWQLLESWRDANPPNCGPHWISAQEVALRLLALVFARAALSDWLAEWPDRERSLLATIGAHAARIPATLAYSRAQGNNHLIAEGVGLFTTGTVMTGPPECAHWRAKGREIVEDGLQEQIFPDGGYVQHSTNYQRLALQLGLWAAVLAQRSGEPLGEDSLAQLRSCASLLGGLIDPESGRAPNFGSNDGAHLLPLSACGFQDYRPALQTAAAALGGLQSWGEGPWDESPGWLGLGTPGAGDAAGRTGIFPQAGLAQIGHGSARGVLRAARFSSRPGHSDQLNLDLWAGSRNFALDPGSYLYNGEPPWQNRLADAAVHNAPVVDGQEPMRRVSRFLWLDWSAAEFVERRRTEDGALELVAAEHDGYRQVGVRQRRTVIRAGEGRWIVVDDLLGSDQHVVVLGWLLPDTSNQPSDDGLKLELEGTELGLRVQPGEHALYRRGKRIWGGPPPYEREQWGWFAPSYALREPALHWVTWLDGSLPLRMRSEWTVGVSEGDEVELDWGPERAGQLPELEAVIFDGRRMEVGG